MSELEPIVGGEFSVNNRDNWFANLIAETHVRTMVMLTGVIRGRNRDIN